MHDRFDALSRKLARARKKIEVAYYEWTAATREVNLLEREQSVLWREMLDKITVGLPEDKESLLNGR
jgi:hypothetical protein